MCRSRDRQLQAQSHYTAVLGTRYLTVNVHGPSISSLIGVECMRIYRTVFEAAILNLNLTSFFALSVACVLLKSE